MAKYSGKLLKKICGLVSKDTYTIAEICTIVNISEDCYYKWQRDNQEFKDAIAQARHKFDEVLVKEAKASLRKKILGYDVDERKTVYVDDKHGKPIIKEQTVTRRHFQPDTAAILFSLTNKAPDEYKNRQTSELTGKDGKDLFANMSDEELDKRIAELEKKLKTTDHGNV
jgi:hypothetical protein